MINKTTLFKLPFYDNNNKKSNINCAEYYNDFLYKPNNINTLQFLIKNAKRGDLIINSFIEKYRNYNIGIIDFEIIQHDLQVLEPVKIIIKLLDESDCYEGYPHVPIEFLDLVINNSNYFKDELSMNDPELENYCINLNKIKFEVYNESLLKILNTNCLIGFKNNILSIDNIIFKLQTNINYNSKIKFKIYNRDDKLVISI